MSSPPSDPLAPARLTSAAACDHCGESLEGVRIVERAVAGERWHYCCLGCAFIAEQLELVHPQAPATPATGGADTPVPRPRSAGSCVQLEVRGMVCAACAQLLAHQLRRAPAVRSAAVDFVTRRAFVVYDPGATDRDALARVVARTGYRVASGGDGAAERRAGRMELLRVLLAWLAMMQVMMLATPSYLARDGQIAPDLEQLLRLAQLVLSAPVAIFCAAPFWRAAASQLRMRAIGMDVPVAIGLAGALAASVVATITGHGAVYFDSVTMFVAFLLSVQWWQMRALSRAAGQFDAAARQARLRANRLRGDGDADATEVVDAELLVAGDHVLVRPGEAIPGDGRIASGTSALSQAWITGESAALDCGVGDPVLAGSINLGQAIVVRIHRSGDETSLAALRRLVVESSGRRPPGGALAGRLASVFALAVLAAAGATVLAWSAVDAAQALRAGIAVLVVTCPCALSLAAPLALAVAQARLAARGLLLLQPAALETLAQIDTIAFDKTGTLTQDQPRLRATTVLGMTDATACLALAAGVDAHSPHPFARALRDAAKAQGLVVPGCVPVAEIPGSGIEGVIGGRRLRLGRPDFALALCRDARVRDGAAAALTDPGARPGSSILLAGEHGPLALLHFDEALRADAGALVQGLRAHGSRLVILSGDTPAAVRSVADTLAQQSGVLLEHHAGLSPAGKCAYLAQLQQAGRRVAMVGDGINDAPVLARADVSIALAGGSALAQVRADIIVPGARITALLEVVDLAQRTRRIIRGNLLWALAYNLVMVPLAALGLLLPWLAASGMALSSAMVLANSLRLRGRSARN